MEKKEVKVVFDGLFSKALAVVFVAALSLIALNPWLKSGDANAAGGCKYSPTILALGDNLFLDTCDFRMFSLGDGKIIPAGKVTSGE